MADQSAKMKVFADFAENLAALSNCKRATAGCIIFPRDITAVYSIGYNGPPAGLPNDGCTGVRMQCGCVHAEANALIKLGHVTDALLLTTRAPCIHCAGLIINSRKISEVYWAQPYTNDRGLDALRSAGILTTWLTL